MDNWPTRKVDSDRHDFLITDVVVRLRRNADGVIREHMDWLLVEAAGQVPNTYIWEGGNYQCDCNRGNFFARYGGEEEPNLDCGDDAFSVRLLHPVSRRPLYSEFEES
jgi:hypothetical protein